MYFQVHDGKSIDYPKIIDSLERQLPIMASDTFKVWVLRDIAYYYQSSSPDSALLYAKRGFILASALNFSSGQIWNLYQKGLAYEFSGKSDSAFLVYQHAIDLARKSEDDLSRAKLYNIKGVAHYYEGNYIDAVENYTLGYVLSDTLGYLEGKAHALNNLGVIYRKQRRYNKALDIYKKSLLLKEFEKDTNGIIISHYNIGLSYSYLGNYDLSLSHLLYAKNLSKEVGQMRWDNSHLDVALGIAYYNLEEYSDSEIHLKKGIENIKGNLSAEYISALAYLGAIQIRNGDAVQGIGNIERSYELGSSLGQPILLRDILKERALAAESAGDLKIAVESWKSFAELNDQLQTETNHWALEEMKAKFELQDKEITIALQNLQIEQEQARKNQYFISGLFVLMLFLISVVFLYFFWKQKEKLKQEGILKQEVLERNDLLLREMHHRTKNNLQLLSSLLSLHSRKSKNQELQLAIKSSLDSVGAINLLHHRLYRNEDFRLVDFKGYLEDMVHFFQNAFGLQDRKILISGKCDQLQLDTDIAIPLGLIINELVTNCIKHAFVKNRGGVIEINLLKSEEGSIVLSVKDNGIGFMNNRSSPNGTGSHLLRIFTEKFNATLSYTQLEQGTEVLFTMPHKEKEWIA